MAGYAEEDWKQLETDYHSNSWFRTEEDPDILLTKQQALPRLRMLSSYLVRNSFSGAGLQQAVVNYTVGKVIDVKVKQKKRTNERVSARLKKDLKKVDPERVSSIASVMRQATGMTFEKGDLLFNTFVDKSGNLACELISGSRIKTPPKEQKNPNVVEGIKKKDGRAIGAYVRKPQVSNLLRLNRDEDFMYVPFFRDITIHGKVYSRRVARMMQAGSIQPADASRAVPPLTPSTGLIRFLEDYLNTTLVCKKASSTIAGFLETNSPKDTADNLSDQSQKGLMKKRGKIQGGAIMSLNRGEKVSFLTPRAASEGDDMFIKRILRLIAFPFRLPYEIAFQDLADVNYSSWKSGQMEIGITINPWEDQVTSCVELYVNNKLLQYHSEGLTKKLPNDFSIITVYPKKSILDPEKDGRGNALEITNKTTSIQEINRNQGTDYETTYNERTKEMEDDVKLESKRLKLIKEEEEAHGIIFPEASQQEQEERTSKKREGESSGKTTDEEKRERRHVDGNQ